MALTEKQRNLIDDAGWINSVIIIEVQGNDKDYVKEALETLVNRMAREKGIEIYETNYDPPQEFKEKWFSINTEVKFLAKDFGLLTRVALLYSPTSFEILDPQKDLKVPIGELQNSLVDISHLVSSLAHAVFVHQSAANRAAKAKKAKKGSKNNTKS
ncbi:MAG: hypothetical protein ABIG20_02845 [archaeon]